MPTTTEAWTSLWWAWLLAVALTWFALEITSIVIAHARAQKTVQEWTLSDTIRRWSAKRRWLAPLAVGVMAMLCWHFFGQLNP